MQKKKKQKNYPDPHKTWNQFEHEKFIAIYLRFNGSRKYLSLLLNLLILQRPFGDLAQVFGMNNSIVLLELCFCLLGEDVDLVLVFLIQNRHRVQGNKH